MIKYVIVVNIMVHYVIHVNNNGHLNINVKHNLNNNCMIKNNLVFKKFIKIENCFGCIAHNLCYTGKLSQSFLETMLKYRVVYQKWG